MKVEKPTQVVQKEQQQEPQQQYRRPSVWTREKINQLIDLYKKNECLWNHWHESYKNKDKRNRAIQEICTTLRITKFDFGKKIHNLRNQFNTEMKKLEQRIEEAGGTVDDASTTPCKWNHFEPLMFLRDVIEPRPGGYQTTFQVPKKMRLKLDYQNVEEDINVTTVLPSNNNRAGSINPEDVTQYQYEDNVSEELIADDFDALENEIAENAQTTSEEVYDLKYQPPPQQSTNSQDTTTTIRTYITPLNHQKPVTSSQQTQAALPQSSSSSQTEIININDDSPVIELSSNNLTVVSSNPQIISTSSCGASSVPVISSVTSNSSSNRPASVLRDQWDAFGELVANEFRNLNSDVSRKRLKRKIMQAMLEVGEEDDTFMVNAARSN